MDVGLIEGLNIYNRRSISMAITYIAQLSKADQQRIRVKESKKLRKLGYKGEEFEELLQLTMDSKTTDLD
jgi:hypothetical protein